MGSLKRFLLFSGEQYYPAGGWGDFHGTYDTLAEALAAAPRNPRDLWWHVIDLGDGRDCIPVQVARG